MVAPRLARLSDGTVYPVPVGCRLVFVYTRLTTDGWHRGDVCLESETGRERQVIAGSVPALGNTRTVRLLGDYAAIFPGELPVVSA
jgi:hypothetical protein